MERFTKDFHSTYSLGPNGRVVVESFNGSVEVSTWDRDIVDVSGSTYGPSMEAAEAIQVSIDAHPDEISIRAVPPMGSRGNRGARFVLKVPQTAVLDRVVSSNGEIHTTGGVGPARLRTSNGAIRVEDLRGRLDVQTSNGRVEVAGLDGDAMLHTSNGPIRGDRLRGSITAESSNGPVDLALEAIPSGGVRARTSNGDRKSVV